MPIKLENVLVKKFLRVLSSTFTSIILRISLLATFSCAYYRTKKKKEKKKKKKSINHERSYEARTGVAAIFMEVDIYDSVSWRRGYF